MYQRNLINKFKFGRVNQIGRMTQLGRLAYLGRMEINNKT